MKKISLYNDKCEPVLDSFEENSIDNIVTDPPYGLQFMNKKWDYDVPSVDLWKKIYRVMKPGATLLCFAGTRTQHRMAVNIEDAGFILKDVIMWLYGCLSEDTEILTINGWRKHNKISKLDRIKIYDITNNIYKWETPERWSIYSVNKNTCYRIESNTTDQIVSKEHTCIIERSGKLIFKQAWELSEMEAVPILSENFYSMEKRFGKILLQKLCWKIKELVKRYCTFREGWVDVNQYGKLSQKNVGGKQSSLERGCNLFQKKRELWQIQNKICKMSRRIFRHGSERWVYNGTQIDSSSKIRKDVIENRSGSPQRSQSRKQWRRQFPSFFKQQSPQIIRSKISKIEYTGKMFCPTVSTGAFVARRNGKVFITGNSGFPKGTNISKQFEKNELSLEAKLWDGWKSHALKPAYEPIIMAVKPNESSYAENALKWGTAGLNIDDSRISLQNEKQPTGSGNPGGNIFTDFGQKNKHKDNETSPKGRYPSNVILSHHPECKLKGTKDIKGTSTGNGNAEIGIPGKVTPLRRGSFINRTNENGTETIENWKCHPDCPIKILDDQAGVRKSGSIEDHHNLGDKKGEKFRNNEIYGVYKIHDDYKPSSYGDTGNASRFFYCAKTSQAERNMGCEELDNKKFGFSGGANQALKKGEDEYLQEHIGLNRIRTLKNHHPTVKPIKLMEYLCKLISNPEDNLFVDPFMGSGTTGIAVSNLGFDFIGIEVDKEYFEIAEKRIEFSRVDEIQHEKRQKLFDNFFE